MIKVDFTPLDVPRIETKIQFGEPVTAEEKDYLENYKEKIKRKKEQERAYQLKRPEREQMRRKKAIEKMTEKICPFLKSNCVGDKCALLKVLVKESEHPNEMSDGEKHYDAMCALNIPNARTRIEYE